MKNTDANNLTGMSIRTLNYVMILAACILYIFILYDTLRISTQYQSLVDATENYINCEKDAALVREGSNYLSEQVWLYTVTADTTYMKAYFQEANVDMRRDNALKSLEELHPGEDLCSLLDSISKCAEDLQKREIYAMKLVSVAKDYNMDNLPDEIRRLELTSQDLSLDRAGKIKRAHDLVFGSGYRYQKSLIEDNISSCLTDILDNMSQAHAQNAEDLKEVISRQRVQLSILFLMNVILFFFISVLIVRPLQIYIRCIKENKALEIIGSYEFKYLAFTYNNIYEINAANEIMLRKKAEQDGLTGLLNRGAFEHLRAGLKINSTPLALLLIDVDHFKEINDHYGHETGDAILIKIAKLLSSSFRSSDYIARIGGDEFVALMTDIYPQSIPMIRKKIHHINEILQRGADGLPKVSLSVGVAFSNAGFEDTLYKRADESLYKVKEKGRCGCAFDGEDVLTSENQRT
ncbi:MAG: GGDEF domain-containing protein [Hominisplanchenecus sp.]|nr:GGDEF domain-containing protein [Lachnospiraceae bacterium]